MDRKTVQAGIYSRISRDNEGNGLGVTRQQDACRKLAGQLGWKVVAVYADNSKSAYDRRKERPEYERLLADVESGRIDGVLCYAVDRLTRHPIELERLVAVFASSRTAVRTVVGGELDLNTEEGQLRARIMGSVARFESGRKGERLRAKAEQLVAEGKRPCGGPRPFGYDRHYDDPKSPRRKIVRETLNKRETAAIRDAADRVLNDGESSRSVIAGWNEQGLLTSMGNRWTLTSFRQMMTSPRLAGLVTHRGRVAEGVTAQWPAILDRETHEQLCALLLKASAGPRGRKRKYWLSGSVYCTCRTVMRISTTPGGRRIYVCKPKLEGGCGGRTVGYDDLDRLIRSLVIKRLSDPAFLRDLAALQDDTRAETKLLMQAIEQDERRLPLLQDQLSDGDPEEIPEIRAAIRKVRARIAENRDELARAVGATPLIGVDVDDLDQRWEDLDVEQKSALLRMAKIEKIIVKPAHQRSRFEPERIKLVPVRS